MSNFAKLLLQALIDDKDVEVDELLQRSDITTWINKTIELNDLKNHNITQEGLKCGESVRTLDELATVLGYVCTYKSTKCLKSVILARTDVSVKSAHCNTC